MNSRKFAKARPDILGTVFCVLACLCAAIYLAAIDSRERYESVMAGHALTARAVIDARLERIVAPVRALSIDPALNVLDAPDGMVDPESIARIARRVKFLTTTTGGRIVIVAEKGPHRVVVDSTSPDASAHMGTVYPYLLPFYTTTVEILMTGKYVIGDLHLSPRLNQHTAVVLVPIVRDEKLIGAIALMLYGDQLLDIVRPTDVPERQFATLVDGANRIVGRTRGERGERTGWPIAEWIAEGMANKKLGVLSGIGMSGIDNLMAFHQLSVAPNWRVIVGEPNAVVNRVFWQPLLWIAVGGLCAFTAMAWWVLAWRQRFFRDTDLIRTQKALLSRLTRTMPAIQFLADVRPDGQFRLSYIAGDFRRVTGRKGEDVTSLTQWERLRAPDARPMRDIFSTALHDGSAVHEFRLAQADGSWRWLRAEVTRTNQNSDGSGEVVGYIVNIDDTRKAEQQAASAVHLSSVGKITSSLASELRRPLAAAHIAAEILEYELASDDTTRAEDRMALIKAKIGYVIQVHDQLQRFARDRGYATSMQAASIQDILTRVQDAVAPALQEDHISLAVNIPPRGCPRVMVNPVDLEQILTCLALNARDAILGQGPNVFRHIRIDVVPTPETQSVSIKVSDNGGGIPADIMPRIFEPFVSTKKNTGNIGLDLAICSALIARMNGAMDARNNDEGAIFTIVLPAAGQGADAGYARES